MVIYTREEKVLIIPEGEGCGCQGGGGHPSKNCEREKREAYESGYTAGLHADCGEAIDEAYNSGYTAGLEACSGSTDCSSAITEAYQSGYTEGYNQGQADCPECSGSTCNIQPLKAVVPQFDNYPVDYQMDIYPDAGYDGLGRVSIDKRPLYEQGYEAGLEACSGSSCTLEEGRLDISDFWDGGPTVVYPSTADGFSQFTVEDTNGSYAYKHYMDGYNDGIAQCSGSTDCSSAVTEAYQSGYTEGYNEGYDDALYEKCDLETTLIVVPSGSTGIMNDITPTEAAGFGSVSVNATEYGEWKYQSGYTAGLEACSGGTSCNLQDDYELYLDGSETAGQMPIWPNEGYDGISQGTVFYMEAYQNQWNSGHTSGFTDGYQSGYTEGYELGLATCSASSGSCLIEAEQTASLGYDWTGFTIVYPSQGYDGLGRVLVADLGYGQRKYDEGYIDGQASVHCPTNVQSTAQKVMTQQVETFYPDAGYDGMGSVAVDGSGLWNSAYTEGHTSGYSEGYNAAITANCGTAIEEAYESGYTEGYDAAGTKIYSSSKDIYFDELAWVDVENSTAYSEEDTIMIDYKWGNTVTGINPIVLFSNESYHPAAVNPPSPTTPSFSIVLHTAGPNITTDDGQGTRDLWLGLQRGAQANHSYRLIVQTYSYTSSVTIKAALIDFTSGQITTGSTNTAVHFTGATSLSYCINGWRNTVDGVYEGMNTDWYLGGIKIFDNTGRMKHNYHFLNGCISDVVNDLETGYEAKYYDNSVETTYPLEGVEETMRFFY